MWIADAQCDDGKRFVVRADELLTAFLELESAIRAGSQSNQTWFIAPGRWSSILRLTT
jgi:hypothetical protein